MTDTGRRTANALSVDLQAEHSDMNAIAALADRAAPLEGPERHAG